MRKLLTFTIACIALAAAPAALASSHASNACLDSESWELGPGIPDEHAEEFRAALSGKRIPVRSFSEALALRKRAESEESRVLAEYWLSRALFAGKLHHIAHFGFTVIASRPLKPETSGVQLAALGCLLQIQNRFPSLSPSPAVTAKLASYLSAAVTEREKNVAHEALTAQIRALVGDERIPTHEIEKLLSLLEGSGPYEAFAKGLIHSRKNEHEAVIRELGPVLTNGLPSSLRKYTDSTRLLLARSLYTRGQYDEAARQFQQVSRSSNDLAVALSELSWSFLLNEKYPEAIGTAMNLQAGGLRHTFTPEAPMVMAMAMNELCQYPESIKAIRIFRKNYEAPYRWLTDWEKSSGAQAKKLYPLAVSYLRKDKESTIPARIASEWVRSPTFIAHQEEINLIFDERENSLALGKSGAKEQARLGREIIELIKDVKPRFHASLAKLKPGEELPRTIVDDLAKLKTLLTQYDRMRAAAPVWRSVLANHKKAIPKIEARLAGVLQQDLERRSHLMLDQLEEIVSNIQMIEVEIYNGASEDIIWQNAHPDYKKLAKELTSEKDDAPAAKVWNWGRSPAAAMEDGGEIWEDELGSFKANLFDNCTSKDRYLALKLKKKRSAAHVQSQ